MYQTLSRLVLPFLLLGAMALQMHAQLIQDALRFNQLQPQGTARSIAMGGAYTAVGADYTSATLNPAGLGVFRGTELSISPYFNLGDSKNNYLQNEAEGSTVLLGVGSVGMSFYGKTDGVGSLKGWSFAMGYNQLGNYLRNARAWGRNDQNSVTHWLANQANGISEGNLQVTNPDYVFEANDLASMAYNTGFETTVGGITYPIFIINPAGGVPDTYVGAFDIANIHQSFGLDERGRHNEWNMAWGGNFNDKFFLGFKLGINDLSYRQKFFVHERDDYGVNNADPTEPAILPVQEVRFEQELRTTGVGINASVGILAHLTDHVRLGMSFHTPSLLSMRDRYTTMMSIEDDFSNKETTTSGENTFNYRMTLPYRLNAGMMFLLGRAGFLTGDVELSDYRMTRYRVPNDPFQDIPLANVSYFEGLNRAIEEQFTLGINYRVGAEFRIMKTIYLRGGFAMYGPIRNELARTVVDELGNSQVIDGWRKFFTAGFGYRREDGFFLNFAMMVRLQNDAFQPYQMPSNTPVMITADRFIGSMVTMGVYIR